MSIGTTQSLAQTACVRCREQKLRCSRQLPQCARCAKLNIDCLFPEPPDRRLIAVRRESRKRRIASSEPDDAEAPSSKRARMEIAAQTIPTPLSQARKSPEDDSIVPSVSSLDADTHRMLQDTYFACMFNSSLTFHRATFEKEYANGDVPEYVLQAMYAMAACLLPGHEYNTKIQALGDATHLSISWALQAAKTALQTVDQPTLPAMQTCLVLAMFWFSRGDYRRNTMFSGIAYRAARCMMQDIEAPEGSPRVQEEEQFRRCFWAAWQMKCVNSDQYAMGSANGPLIMALRLPVGERAFLQRRRGDAGSLDERSKVSPGESPSIMAEFMRLVLLWARVRDYIDARRSNPQSEAWNNSFLLYDELAQWARQLHPSLAYSKRNLYELLVVQQQPVCLVLYALYHQSCLVLQASLVPSLSGSLSQDNTPPQAVRVSADMALDHAEALSVLAADLLALDWEPTRIAPFVGYAMYVAAAVHLTIMGRDSGKEENARKHLVPCLRLLGSMKSYWALLGQLWDRLQRLFDLQMPKAGTARTSSHSPETTLSGELGCLADRTSDARNINEVLNDSVLYFSLRKTQRPPNDIGESHSSALDDIVSQASKEQIPEMLGRGKIGMSRDSFAACISVPEDEEERLSAMNLAGDGFGVSNAPGVQPLSNYENWWEWNLDPEVEGQFSFDDLFGMDLTFQ